MALLDSALVVFSGGQDSTTCLHWALKNFKQIRALSFDYNQRHKLELDCARTICQSLNIPHAVLEFSLFQKLGGNALTDDRPIENRQNSLPNTFVPGRNLMFLTAAAAYAYKYGINHLVTGVCETDYSGYPDCRDDTIKALQVAINLGMDTRFVIHTPLMRLNKAQTVQLAVEVGAMDSLAFSHTCYEGVFPPCGVCPACILRKNGFSEAGIEDPLLKRIGADVKPT
jgi:7-cyano-7-deazaguanine synthase